METTSNYLSASSTISCSLLKDEKKQFIIGLLTQYFQPIDGSCKFYYLISSY